MDIKEKEQELKELFQKEKEELVKSYGEIVEKLKKEGEKLQVDLQKEYDHMKQYVKEHPETSVGVALAGGLVVGLLIAKLLKK